MQSDLADNPGRTLVLLAVTLAAVMFVLPLAIPFPLLDPDEGLHASIAQEMVERGDWLIPRFLGEPFLDKPILYFWVQAASLWLFGPSEAAMRLPGLMFGLLGVITTGLLAWRLFDRRTGWIAGILYATTILPTAMAQAASHDVALIPWINLALLLLWESDRMTTRRAIWGPTSRHSGADIPVCQENRGDSDRQECLSHQTPSWLSSPRGERTCLVGAGVFLGLSILTKGLFGVAVVGLAYGSYLLIARRMRPVMLLRGAVVLIIAALVASPWYVLVEMRTPGYLHYFFLERHVLGLATSSQRHGNEAWWYYLPILLGGGLPWIGYLPIVVQDGLARRHSDGVSSVWKKGDWLRTGIPNVAQDSDGEVPVPLFPQAATTLLWCWLIGWTLLMTLAGSKLATYIWPVFPAIAILAATAWIRRIDGSLSAAACRSFARTFVSSSWSGPIVLPAVVLVVQFIYGVRFDWPAWVAVALVAAAAPLPLIPWRAGRWQASLAAAALSLAVQFVVAMTLVIPPVAEALSAHALAEHFNQQGQIPTRLFVVGERIGSLVYYLTPSLRATLETGQFQPFIASEPPPLRLGDVVAVSNRKFSQVRERLDLDGAPYESAGRYRLYVIEHPSEKQ